MNQNIIKGLLVAAIWCSNILVLQAAQDNIAPRAHVTVSNVLNENYAADNLVDGKIMYDDRASGLAREVLHRGESCIPRGHSWNGMKKCVWIEWCCMTGYLLLNTLPVELFISVMDLSLV